MVKGLVERKRSSADEMRGLITRAQTYLSDSREESISLDLRYQAAYEAGRMWCEVAIRAAGFRATAASGHHEAVISGLPAVIGSDAEKLARILDNARKNRHTIMYGGSSDITAPSNVKNLIDIVEKMQDMVMEWLEINHPELLP